jgi:phage-related protein
MATLPNIRPDYANTSRKNEPRVLWNSFGDGYSQRAADGINNDPAEWTLGWIGRPLADINTLDDFFKARKGFEAFDWTPERETTSKKFVCKTWNRSFVWNGNDSITATFIQVFDI